MEDQIWNDIIKRLTGVETEDSKQRLNLWLSANKANEKLYHEAEQLWEMTGMLPSSVKPKNETILIHPSTEKNRAKPFKGLFKYGVAASIVVFAAVTAYYFSRLKIKPNDLQTVYTVHKAAKGKVMEIVLPDSSVIWLNAGSEVSYPKDFYLQKTRTIRLTGEAFFDVTHNKEKPFIVESGNFKTIVYGTSFNVSAYNGDKQSSVTVKTGKVGVVLTNDTSSAPTMLLPGNRLVYHLDDGKLDQTEISTDQIATWLKGDLIFDQAHPVEVFATLARKFDVTFNYNEADFEGCKLTARFPNQSLNTILNALSTSLHIKVNEHGKTIEVKGGQRCN